MSDLPPIARELVGPLTASELSLVELYGRLRDDADDVARGDARLLAGHAVAMAIAEAKEAGTYWLPEDLGSQVLAGAAPEDSFLCQVIENLRGTLPLKRADGMSDDDFLAFWNTTEIERRMHLLSMDAPNQVLHIDSRGDRPPSDRTALQQLMVLTFGVYGHPSTESGDRSPHRPLPYEVQNRVAEIVDVHSWDFGDLRARITRCGSLNAFYRSTVESESDPEFDFG